MRLSRCRPLRNKPVPAHFHELGIGTRLVLERLEVAAVRVPAAVAHGDEPDALAEPPLLANGRGRLKEIAGLLPEMNDLADWLESPQFPRGSYSQLTPP
jgi:hypothetical protein